MFHCSEQHVHIRAMSMAQKILAEMILTPEEGLSLAQKITLTCDKALGIA